MQQPKPCVVCGKPTKFLSLTFDAWLCSTECEDILWTENQVDDAEFEGTRTADYNYYVRSNMP